MSERNKTRVTRSIGSNNRKLAYRALLQDLSLEENDNVQQMDKTARVLREAKLLLANGPLEERVQHPGEVYLDSKVLRATSDMAVRSSDAVTGNVNTYDKSQLAAHIRENPQFWQWTFPKEVCSIVSLQGCVTSSPLERVPRVRRQLQARENVALTAPQTVDKIEKSEAGSKMVDKVYKFINNKYKQTHTPLSYFHIVIDPNNFSRTLENVYNVSFLVKDGLVAIELDEECGVPVVRPIPPSCDDNRDIAEENQFIVSLDMQRWRELTEAFQIREPMMVLKKHN